jgi:hypothetical protein
MIYAGGGTWARLSHGERISLIFRRASTISALRRPALSPNWPMSFGAF